MIEVAYVAAESADIRHCVEEPRDSVSDIELCQAESPSSPTLRASPVSCTVSLKAERGGKT
jgi:hypothetical protein